MPGGRVGHHGCACRAGLVGVTMGRYFPNEDGPEDGRAMSLASGHNGSFARWSAAEQGTPSPCPPAIRERLRELRRELVSRHAHLRQWLPGVVL